MNQSESELKERLLIAAILLAQSVGASAATFNVTNVDDSGVGSLRRAIEQANASPGIDMIVGPSCIGGCQISLASALPPITDAVSISRVTIDGTHAGAADGFVVDADKVSFDSVKATNFAGDGFVIRGNSAFLTFVKSISNENGVRIDGRDTGLYSSQVSGNRAAGIWITSTASENWIGRPDAGCMTLCPPWPWGPVDVSGNGGAGILIDGSRNTIDSNRVGLLGSPNAGSGIVVNGAHNVLVNNILSHNQADGAFLTLPAKFESNSGGCNVGLLVDGSVIAPPVITAAWADRSVITAVGEFRATPSAEYRIELHEVPDCGDPSRPVAYTLLGAATTMTDASGVGQWRVMVAHAPVASVFAIANRGEAEETSRTSAVFSVTPTNETRADLSAETTAPASAITGQEIEFVTTVTNRGPAAIDAVMVLIPATNGTVYLSATTTSGQCWLSGGRYCQTGVLGPGDTATIRERVRVTAPSGILTYVATATWYSYGYPHIDPDASNNAARVTVSVSPSSIPAASPVMLLLIALSLAIAGAWLAQR